MKLTLRRWHRRAQQSVDWPTSLCQSQLTMVADKSSLNEGAFQMKRYLVLEDGTVHPGTAIGANQERIGELVLIPE